METAYIIRNGVIIGSGSSSSVGKDGVQIDDETASTDTVWSSQKTSDEIAKKVDKTDITTTIDSTSTDTQVPSAKSVNELNLRGTQINQSVIDKYGTEILKYPFGRWYIDGNEIAGKFSDMPWATACIIDITSPIISTRNPWDNTWAYRNYRVQTIENKGTFVRQLESRGTPGVLLDTGWQELATMDKVALKHECFNKKVTLTDSNWKYKKLTFTKSYMNTPSVNVSCGDYLNPEFYSYWGCEAYIININNEGCTIRYRSSKASESEPLEVNIIVFVNGI